MQAGTLLDDRPDPDCLLARARQTFQNVDRPTVVGEVTAEIRGSSPRRPTSDLISTKPDNAEAVARSAPMPDNGLAAASRAIFQLSSEERCTALQAAAVG